MAPPESSQPLEHGYELQVPSLIVTLPDQALSQHWLNVDTGLTSPCLSTGLTLARPWLTLAQPWPDPGLTLAQPWPDPGVDWTRRSAVQLAAQRLTSEPVIDQSSPEHSSFLVFPAA